MKKRSKNKLTTSNYQLAIGKWLTLILIVANCSWFMVSCSSKESSHEHDRYTCPMHPTVISDKPGTCPVCGMDLVRKGRPGEEIEITEELAKLIKSPNEVVISSIKTIKPEYKTFPTWVEAQGMVTYDTRYIHSVSARVSGRLEKIFLSYEFQGVSKGQRIADLYSAELTSAQRELIFLFENDGANTQLINDAKEKLKLLGLNPSQLDNLIETRVVRNTITMYSPYDGYLVNNLQAPTTPATASTGPGMAGGMESTPTRSAESTPAALVREGGFVTKGQTLFTLVSKDAFRIEIDLPSNLSGAINTGDKLEIDLGNGQITHTTVDFVQPFFNGGEDFTKIRVVISHIEGLHIGHLVTTKIQLSSIESLWVPKQAVLDLGNEQVVFLKDRKVIKPRKVVVGSSSGAYIEIKSGLASSDEIASDAHYLIDSESFIKTTN